MGCCTSSEAKDLRQITRNVDDFRKSRDGQFEARDRIATQFEAATAHHFSQPSDEDVRTVVVALRQEHQDCLPLKEKSQEAADQLKQAMEQLAQRWEQVVDLRQELSAATDAAGKKHACLLYTSPSPRDS
eukprot:TRINITY_DN13717_c0_g3_i4.p2 TRINITY_DN13717_c0_g3~~TRINITY_DN13717_c0_g3_i4.p2  ORF type:complete len:130 (-),score=40.23 TRINITY_DN13717_c0_g3_i4:153-542(-)